MIKIPYQKFVLNNRERFNTFKQCAEEINLPYSVWVRPDGCYDVCVFAHNTDKPPMFALDCKVV